MIKQRLTTPQLRRELQHALLHARITAMRARGTARSSTDRAWGSVRAVAAYAATSGRALAGYLAGVTAAALADRSRTTRIALVGGLVVVAGTGLVLLLGHGAEPVAAPQPAGTVIASTVEPAAVPPGKTPECPPVDRTHRVARGETLSQVALRYGTGLEQIVADSNVADPNLITVGQLLRIRSLCKGTTVITPGATLAGLAAANSTTVAALLALNPQITNPARIHAGGVLRVAPKEPT